MSLTRGSKRHQRPEQLVIPNQDLCEESGYFPGEKRWKEMVEATVAPQGKNWIKFLSQRDAQIEPPFPEKKKKAPVKKAPKKKTPKKKAPKKKQPPKKKVVYKHPEFNLKWSREQRRMIGRINGKLQLRLKELDQLRARSGRPDMTLEDVQGFSRDVMELFASATDRDRGKDFNVTIRQVRDALRDVKLMMEEVTDFFWERGRLRTKEYREVYQKAWRWQHYWNALVRRVCVKAEAARPRRQDSFVAQTFSLLEEWVGWHLKENRQKLRKFIAGLRSFRMSAKNAIKNRQRVSKRMARSAGDRPAYEERRVKHDLVGKEVAQRRKLEANRMRRMFKTPPKKPRRPRGNVCLQLAPKKRRRVYRGPRSQSLSLLRANRPKLRILKGIRREMMANGMKNSLRIERAQSRRKCQYSNK